MTHATSHAKAAFVALLLFIVVALIGVGASKKEDTTKENIITGNSYSVAQAKEIAGWEYIEELDVMVPHSLLPEGLKIESLGPNSVTFTTVALEKMGCGVLDDTGGSLVRIDKLDVSYGDEEVHWMQDGNALTQKAKKKEILEFDTFFLVYSHPHATCSDDPKVQAMQTDLIKRMKQVSLAAIE